MSEINKMKQIFMNNQEICVNHINSMMMSFSARGYRKEDEPFYVMSKVIIDRARELEKALINPGEEPDAAFSDFLDLLIEGRKKNKSPDEVIENLLDAFVKEKSNDE